MAKHKVLKDFPYAHDGIETKPLVAGDEAEIRPELAAGLIAGGYIADPEIASKVAGAAIKNADHAGAVDSDAQVKREIVTAEAGISDGHIGKPEAAAIVHEHRLTDLSDPATIAAAQDEKAEHHAKGGKPKGDKA